MKRTDYEYDHAHANLYNLKKELNEKLCEIVNEYVAIHYNPNLKFSELAEGYCPSYEITYPNGEFENGYLNDVLRLTYTVDGEVKSLIIHMRGVPTTMLTVTIPATREITRLLRLIGFYINLINVNAEESTLRTDKDFFNRK